MTDAYAHGQLLSTDTLVSDGTTVLFRFRIDSRIHQLHTWIAGVQVLLLAMASQQELCVRYMY